MLVVFFILAGVIAALPWIVGRHYGMLPWVSPMHIVSYFALFGVLLKTLALAIAPELMMFNQFGASAASIVQGYIYLTGFILVMVIGYLAGIRRRTAPDLSIHGATAVWRVRRPGALALVSVGVLVAASMAILAARGISGFSSIFAAETIYALNTQKIVRSDDLDGFGKSFAAVKSLFIVPTFALVVWLGRQIERPTAGGALVTTTMVGMVVFTIMFQAKRMELIDVIFYYLCIFLLLGHKVRGRMALNLAFGLGAVVMLFIIMTTLRATKGGLDNIELQLLGSLLQVSGSSYFLDINMPVIIFDNIDRFEFFYGQSYFYWLFGWVPRDLWPQKPAITLGPFVKQQVLGIYGSVGGINPTGPGEAMLNFGWAGMLVGAALGFMYRRIEEYLLRDRVIAFRGGLWLYPLVFYPFIAGTLQSSFSATLIGAVVNVALLKTLLSFSSKRYRKRKVISPFHNG